MRHVGIDLSKKEGVAAFLMKEGEVIEWIQFRNEPSGYAELEARLERDDRLVVEASTYSYPLHDHFKGKGYTVIVAHPAGNEQITKSESKTDRKDAYHLANLDRTGYLHKAYIPDPKVLRLRDMLRTQEELGRESARTKNRIHAYLFRNGVQHSFGSESLFTKRGMEWLQEQRWNDERDAILQARLTRLENIRREREMMEVQMAKSGINDERVSLLMTIPGVNTYLGLMLVAEIGDINRFQTIEAFRRYAGCCPSVRQSGGTRHDGKLQGSSGHLKWAMSLIAQTIVRFNNPIREYYQKQRCRTHSSGRALARTRRKVCDMIYAMLKRMEKCRWDIETNTKMKTVRMKSLACRDLPSCDRRVLPGAS